MDLIRILHWPVEMMGKPRMTQSDKWEKREVTTRYWETKDALKAYALRDKFVLGKVLHAVFLLPMPVSWSKKKKELYFGKLHDAKPDTDNLLKGLKDCLAKDDSKVAVELAIKLWSYEAGLLLYQYNEDTIILSRLDLCIATYKRSAVSTSSGPPDTIFAQNALKSVLGKHKDRFEAHKAIVKRK